MNGNLEKIMIFINENTNILIGICLFLIFVLVAYLIDNSIKSKKALKELEATKKQEMEEEIKKIPTPTENNSKEKMQETNISDSMNKIETLINNYEENNIKNEYTEENVNAYDDKKIETETEIVLNSSNEIIKDSNSSADVIYKNDKKLSDILGNLGNSNDKSLNEIIQSDTSPINNVEPKIEIDLNDSELDNIIKKINNGNAVDEDDYTNIF